MLVCSLEANTSTLEDIKTGGKRGGEGGRKYSKAVSNEEPIPSVDTFMYIDQGFRTLMQKPPASDPV